MSYTVEALRQVLGRVYDYADLKDFRELWDALDSTDSPSPKVIIYWHETAPDPEIAKIDTALHVTPIAWAACAVRRWPGLDIRIADAGSSREQYPAWRELNALKPSRIGWVRVCSPTDVPALMAHREPEEDRASRKRDAKLFLDRLRLELVDAKPEKDHHSITNLVGPLVLLKDPEEFLTPHRKALLHVLKGMELVPHRTEPDKALREALRAVGGLRLLLLDDMWQHGWAHWLAQVLGCRPLDPPPSPDSPEPALFARKDDLELCVLANPMKLLENAIASLKDTRDARFRFEPLGSDGMPTVLLLDLRLFSSSKESERTFLEGLLKNLKDLKGRVRPWGDTITADDLTKLGAWLDAGNGLLDEDLRITLFARLLADVDLALPIVVFSSTGRRGAMKKLADCKNVITVFEKPRFFGEAPGDVVERTEAGLHQALLAASAIARGRVAVQKVLHHAPRRPPAGCRSHIALYLDESGEEPEQARMVVGGIAALFKDDESERTFNEALIQQDIHWGRNGLPKRPREGATEGERLCFQRTAADAVAAVQKLATEHNVHLAGVALHAAHASEDTFFSQKASRDLDQGHRRLTRAVTELSLLRLFDIPPGEWTATILTDMRKRPANLHLRDNFGLWKQSLDNDERLAEAINRLIGQVARADATVLKTAFAEALTSMTDVVIEDDESRKAVAGLLLEVNLEKQTLVDTIKSAIEKLGAGVAGLPKYRAVLHSRMTSHISQNSVFPFVDDILRAHRRHRAVKGLTVVEAQACPLSTGILEKEILQRRPHSRSRSLHFLADWFVNQIGRHVNLRRDPADWVKTLTEQGFVVGWEQPIRGLSQIADWIDEGDARAALSRLVTGSAWLLDSDDPLTARCLMTIAEFVEAAGGPDIVGGFLSATESERGWIRHWGTIRGQWLGLVESRTFADLVAVDRDVPKCWNPEPSDPVRLRRTRVRGRVSVASLKPESG